MAEAKGAVATERSRGSHPARWGLLVWVAGVIVLIDQATKILVQANLTYARPVPVLGDFFRLTYIYNPGAAFGMNVGEHSQIFFGVLAAVILVVLIVFYRQTPPAEKAKRVAIAAVAGGAVGNLIDRIRSPRGVVDFLDVGLDGLRWPVFNVADMAVVCGVFVLLFVLWREDDAAPDGAG